MAKENIIIQREIKTRKTGMVFLIQKCRVKGRRTQEEWCTFYNGARVLFIRKFRPLHRSSGLCSPLERSKHQKNGPLCLFTARAVYAHRSSGEHPGWQYEFCLFDPSLSLLFFNP